MGKKVVVFFGTADSPEYPPGIGVKLPHSNALALSQPGVNPMGYGLGKAGWVGVALKPEMPFEMLREWIDESYRAVAPRKLIKELEVGTRVP